MQTHPGLPDAADAYLADVMAHLQDVDAVDREELITPVRQRLAELSEHGADRRRIEEVFGSSAAAAADLREGAGLPSVPRVTGTPPARQSLAAWLVGLSQRAPIAPVIDYAASLAPAWWAARGLLLFAAALAIFDQGGEDYDLHTIGGYRSALQGPATPHLTTWWLALPLLAMIVSIIVGRYTARLPRPLQLLVAGLNVLAVFALLAWPTWWMGPAFAFYSGLVS